MISGTNASGRFWLGLAAALLVTGVAGAKTLMSKEEALDWGFPEADRVSKEVLYFSEAEAERVEERADAPMDSRLFTVYEAYQGGEVSGYGFIDTRTIRSKPATFLVVLDPDGSVRSARILAWQEPPEYQPPERWLAQFEGRELERSTRLGGTIQAMSGASLTSRTLTDGLRRVLAIHRVKLAEKG
ncbi:FMN-binding protein [Thiohalorhabdus sp.]|uniref:FMN-binding protein n=1 Tax=Thiohalorhabdus sp. TaxID=3094134 RepID=UPI002FC3B836